MASIAISPFRVSPSATTTVTVYGTGTTFTSSISLAISGVSGASLGSTTVVNDTKATVPVTAGSTRGTATITDSVSGATVKLTIAKARPKWVPRRR